MQENAFGNRRALLASSRISHRSKRIGRILLKPTQEEKGGWEDGETNPEDCLKKGETW